MSHIETLTLSWRQFWHNKSLFIVMLLGLILTGLLALLFFIISAALALKLEPGLVGAIEIKNLPAIWELLTAPGVIWPLLLLFALQMAVFIAVDTAFRAGFAGMVKNIIRDGSTTIREFTPEMRRFYGPMLGFQLIKYALLAIAAIPMVVLFLRMMPQLIALSEYPASLGAGEVAALIGTSILAVFLFIAVILFFIYGEAVIVLEDASAWEATRQTVRVVRAHLGTTILVVLITFLLTMLAGIVESVVTVPLAVAAEATGARGYLMASDIFSLLYNLVTLAVGIIASLYVFNWYVRLVGARRQAPARQARPQQQAPSAARQRAPAARPRRPSRS